MSDREEDNGYDLCRAAGPGTHRGGGQELGHRSLGPRAMEATGKDVCSKAHLGEPVKVRCKGGRAATSI
jgi:hypothetical protein